MSIKTEIEVSHELIAGEICTAMEQGSGYWARVTGDSEILTDDGKDHYLGKYYHKFFHGGWTEFCELDSLGELDEEDSKRYRLDIESIKDGIRIMAEKYPRHYGDFMAENGDAITADVFLQCCLLKDIVYG